MLCSVTAASSDSIILSCIANVYERIYKINSVTNTFLILRFRCGQCKMLTSSIPLDYVSFYYLPTFLLSLPFQKPNIFCIKQSKWSVVIHIIDSYSKLIDKM